MMATQGTPTLMEAIADKKEFEYNLEIAKGKASQLITEVNELKFNVQSLKKDFEELEKRETFYEGKYNVNAKRLCNLAFVKRKYEMNIKWFENYKLNMSAAQSPNDDKYAKAVGQKEKLDQQKESLLHQVDELTASILHNNQQYQEVIEKIKNMDLITFLK